MSNNSNSTSPPPSPPKEKIQDPSNNTFTGEPTTTTGEATTTTTTTEITNPTGEVTTTTKTTDIIFPTVEATTNKTTNPATTTIASIAEPIARPSNSSSIIGEKRERMELAIDQGESLQLAYMKAMQEMMEQNRANAAESARLAEERFKLELEKAKLESDAKLTALEARLSVKSERSQSGGSDRGVDRLVKDTVLYETSVGWLKTDLFITNLGYEDLPDDFPLYSWPKCWKGRQKMARALLYMRDLIKTKSLYECVLEMSRKLGSQKKFLRPSEYRIIEPILSGKVKKDGSDFLFKQDALELCLLSQREFGLHFPGIMYACRSIPATHAEDDVQWGDIMAGREWPGGVLHGFKVGVPKEKFKRPTGESGN
jgi:hypothetical protein